MDKRIIGIMGAMPEEISGLTGLLSENKAIDFGGRTYNVGVLGGINVVIVFSKWGKVAAATTVTALISKFNITELIFTGVAGAISPELKIGDVVIGKRLVQHDMDIRPLGNQFEIPLLGVTYFESNPDKVLFAEEIVARLLHADNLETIINPNIRLPFGIETPRVFVGDIATGDKFISSTNDKVMLLNNLPTTLCVEMEGAAVAQVCYEYNIPYTIFRTISDVADDHAAIDFPSFVKNISCRYALEIIRLYFMSLDSQQ